MSEPQIAEPPDLTKTERVFFNALSDGKPHSIADLTQHLWDELGVNLRLAVQMHISRMRPKLAAKGMYISTANVGGSLHYSLIRLIH